MFSKVWGESEHHHADISQDDLEREMRGTVSSKTKYDAEWNSGVTNGLKY